MRGDQLEEVKDERLNNTPADFEKKHPLYEIHLDKIGPEFSEIDERRIDFIKKYAGKLEIPLPPVPQNIEGKHQMI